MCAAEYFDGDVLSNWWPLLLMMMMVFYYYCWWHSEVTILFLFCYSMEGISILLMIYWWPFDDLCDCWPVFQWPILLIFQYSVIVCWYIGMKCVYGCLSGCHLTHAVLLLCEEAYSNLFSIIGTDILLSMADEPGSLSRINGWNMRKPIISVSEREV
jgi:hypothetical protein